MSLLSPTFALLTYCVSSFMDILGEGATDAGGPYRESISTLCQDLQSDNIPTRLVAACFLVTLWSLCEVALCFPSFFLGFYFSYFLFNPLSLLFSSLFFSSPSLISADCLSLARTPKKAPAKTLTSTSSTHPPPTLSHFRILNLLGN